MARKDDLMNIEDRPVRGGKRQYGKFKGKDAPDSLNKDALAPGKLYDNPSDRTYGSGSIKPTRDSGKISTPDKYSEGAGYSKSDSGPKSSNYSKSDGAKVTIPTRQPTAPLSAFKDNQRVGIPTSQPKAPLASKRMNLIATAKQKIQGRASVALRKVSPSITMSNIARRLTLRTKR